MKKFAGLLLLIAALSACTITKQGKNFTGQSAKQLYSNAERAMADRKFYLATRYLESLDANYPFSPYSEQAQLDSVYAYYKTGDHAAAVAAAERYIHLYPRSKHVDYAYYMKGVANFEQKRGVALQFLPVDLSQRALGTAKEAYQDFATLIRLFPNSQYAADARQKILKLRNLLKEREVHIATFYMKRHAYVAAANRANYVVRFYSESPQTEKALAILVKANQKLGLDEAAQKSLAVLKRNYPKSAELKRLQAAA